MGQTRLPELEETGRVLAVNSGGRWLEESLWDGCPGRGSTARYNSSALSSLKRKKRSRRKKTQKNWPMRQRIRESSLSFVHATVLVDKRQKLLS